MVTGSAPPGEVSAFGRVHYSSHPKAAVRPVHLRFLFRHQAPPQSFHTENTGTHGGGHGLQLRTGAWLHANMPAVAHQHKDASSRYNRPDIHSTNISDDATAAKSGSMK